MKPLVWDLTLTNSDNSHFHESQVQFGFLKFSQKVQFVCLMFNLSHRFDVWICLFYNHFV